MKPSDFASPANAAYLEELFDQYKQDPDSVPEQWRVFFAGFEMGLGRSDMPGIGHLIDSNHAGVFDLVHSYRELGHHCSDLDPLKLMKRPEHPMLALSNFNLTEADLGKQVGSGGFRGETDGTLGGLLARLKQTYCGKIGVEFTHISNAEQREWLTQKMEASLNKPAFTPEQTRNLMFQLSASEDFEQYLAKAFIGTKRFSLEGAESMIPLLNEIIDHGCAVGGEQFIMCMAHRGRLNVLAHVQNKPYETILGEFAGTNLAPAGDTADGDVKYHLGYANSRPEPGGKQVKISMLPNPSHLELINPIHQGIVRCKQEWLGDTNRDRVIPIQIHGDAAFVGQGIVAETLNLSELAGWRTGGTLHLIINNQIGFTTPPEQGRFTPYCTDAAKAIEAPIFHVNGDDPEAVIHCARLAIEFRQKFLCDVIIDVYCYRRNGHNETDEPTFTQPVMYKAIKDHKTTRRIYADRLLEEGRVTQTELDEMKGVIAKRLTDAREKAKESKQRERVPQYGGVWKGYGKAGDDWSAHTAVDAAMLEKVISVYDQTPATFTVHPKLVKLIEDRKDAVRKDAGLDWATGEMLAFGSLLLEGFGVRLTGQDVERGTFSHRHAVLTDYNTGEKHYPLKALHGYDKSRFYVRNSVLSEEAVLGFEWGYNSSDPRNLGLWEAQFGDFVNGAQNMIDQIIAAAEDKWRFANGLVMLLPHGYEGQGPEHSNAYIERFLSLCAENNMQVCIPSTPANYFHMLRRQMHRKFRKPLVLMMPKALLRLKDSFSHLRDLTGGSVRLVIDDPNREMGGDKLDEVRRVLLCSGKVYYTLEAARKANNVNNVAIVRVEQLYPLPRAEMKAVLSRYRRKTDVVWVQEEPHNRGGWRYIEPHLRGMFADLIVSYAGRVESASPAAGSKKQSDLEEERLVADALDFKKTEKPIAAPAKTPVASK
ncbi:MAG: 2-oxoglutarate dehydrogenase E1 component [Tepidisphaeraceae bacterium]